MKNTRTSFHSLLADRIRQFVTGKRSLGRRYDSEEKTLRLFDRYVAQQEITQLRQITPDRVAAFLASRPRQRPRSYNHLLCTIRRLFDWMVVQGIVPRSPVQARPRRQVAQRIPFIFDQPAARRLLAAASGLRDNPKGPMRGITYHAIFAILYGLGLRVGEACRLHVRDVDMDRHLLVIRQTKFYKSRWVPFGPKMAALLQAYRQAKVERVGTLPPDAPLFSFTTRGEVHPCTVSQVFHALVPRLGLVVPPGCSPPRLHDLRHAFAVGTLLRWYRGGKDIGAELLKLSTFLGHVDVNSTAVYLTITPALFQEANRRFEAFVVPVLRKEVLS
jgi:site-specific recombinase XerD